MIYWSIVLMLLMIIAMFAMIFYFRAQPAMMISISMTIGWVAIGIYVLNVVGTLLCLATPTESGATNWIYGSVCFMLINISITLGNILLDDLSPTIQAVQQPAHVVSSIFFVLFLHKLALSLGAPRLASQARSVLIAGVVLLVLLLVQFAITFGLLDEVMRRGGNVPGAGRANFNRPELGLALAGVGLTALITALYVLIKYSSLLNNLFKTIRGRQSPE
jgi:hypothetical protein